MRSAPKNALIFMLYLLGLMEEMHAMASVKIKMDGSTINKNLGNSAQSDPKEKAESDPKGNEASSCRINGLKLCPLQTKANYLTYIEDFSNGNSSYNSVHSQGHSYAQHAYQDLKPSLQVGSTSSQSQTSTISTVSKQSNPSDIFEQEDLPIVDSTLEKLSEIRGMIMNSDYTDVFEKPLVERAANHSMVASWLLESGPEGSPGGKMSSTAYSSRGGRPFLYTGKMSTRTGKNCYLVKLKPNLSPETVSKIRHVLEVAGGKIKHDYNFGLFAGYAVCFRENVLPISLLKAVVGIAHVERDQYSQVKYVQEGAPWQLTRMNDQKAEIATNQQYLFNSTGIGVNVYVIDSGVMIDHPEFGGRAKIGYTIFNDFPNDCAGHGTQVSSVIAGTNVGMAKLANIIVAQVLDCDGQGENSAVMAALNWIVTNHQKPAVVNMSVGGPKSPTVDDAVRAAVERGLGVVVAAGNSMIDACSLSPSGVHAALVVGASTVEQERAKFSNFGPCVDIFAPGRHIIAAAVPNQATKNGFTFVSGTSLSAPLVTGIYALLLESKPELSPAQLKAAVLQLGMPNLLAASTLYGSPNLVAQTPSLPSTPDVTLAFLPAGTLPTFGVSTSNSELELIMIIVAACFAGLFVLAIIVLLIRRCRRRKEKPDPKYPTSFQ